MYIARLLLLPITISYLGSRNYYGNGITHTTDTDTITVSVSTAPHLLHQIS